ncbi:MAG: phosphoribosylformylglycinamidine synthase subunit PurL [Acidimicrobiales bacterium]
MTTPVDTVLDPDLHRKLGLTDDEMQHLIDVLGRRPNPLELAMVSVMWSEHCSYKSSRIHLRRLPTEGPGVLVGPGENAGVIDVGDGIAAAIRIESHNHPSAVEPYQGAATGVGGIIRDIFTMGARPIALMDPLCFGPLEDPKNRWLFDRVVGGIAGYGNAVGVPTVGGELTLDECYSRNPLVNVLCLGLLPTERLVLGRAAGIGNVVVLLGSTTGRDGIGGVSVLASAGFRDEESDGSKRPSVQVGDPFEEKRLIEASLELLDHGLVVGIQDLGGAGLTCATSETAARAGTGMDFDVTTVPLREPGMTPAEIMTSESQERMLAIVEPKDLEAVLEVCARWEVRATVVAKVTDTGRLRITDGPDGEVLADLPAPMLSEDAPLYHRPLEPPADIEARRRAVPGSTTADGLENTEALLSMMVDYSWIFRQYDHQLFLNTVEPPGGDAAVLRVAGPGLPASDRGLALSTDANPRWCDTDPRVGTGWLVAESAINVACAGAEPRAVVNCLNFGNPEHPEVMWQLSEAVDGMSEACIGLGLPVVGGNVSLYNESAGADIAPTPVVAVLGVIDKLLRKPPGMKLRKGASLVLLGSSPTSKASPTSGTSGNDQASLSGSRLAARAGDKGGTLRPLDFRQIKELIGFLVETVGQQGSKSKSASDSKSSSDSDSASDELIHGLHDVSDGGLAVCLGELAVNSKIGLRVSHETIADTADLFSETPGRVVVCTTNPDLLLERAAIAGVPATLIGEAGGDRVVVGSPVGGLIDVALDRLVEAWTEALPRALGESSRSHTLVEPV